MWRVATNDSSHAEMRSTHRSDGLRRPAHLDLRCGFATEEVEQQFARRATESGCRLAPSNNHPFVGADPVDVEPARGQPPTQEAAPAPHVPPQGGVQFGCQAARSPSVSPANVLVMDEELVEIRHRADPLKPEEPNAADRTGFARRAIGSRLAPRQLGPAPLGEPLKGSGQHQARAGEQIVFAQHYDARRDRAPSILPTGSERTDRPRRGGRRRQRALGRPAEYRSWQGHSRGSMTCTTPAVTPATNNRPVSASTPTV